MRRRRPTRRKSTRTSSPAWLRRATRRSRYGCSPSGTCASTSRRSRDCKTGDRIMLQLIDRRPSSRGKSAVNRERFLRRYKSHIQAAVKKMVGERKLADMEQGGEVRVPKKDISEPSFGFGRGGDREIVLPGNREYVAGDRIARPSGSGSGGRDGSEGGQGETQDDFVFSLSREEFMQLFFDDLELPNLVRTELGRAEQFTSIRSGYSKSGTPANL